MNFLDFIHARGHTSYSLAKATGISVRTIENYTNKRFPLRNSRAWFIVAVADALGVTPKELLEEVENDDARRVQNQDAKRT